MCTKFTNGRIRCFSHSEELTQDKLKCNSSCQSQACTIGEYRVLFSRRFRAVFEAVFEFVFAAEFQVSVARDYHIRHRVLSNVKGLVGA